MITEGLEASSVSSTVVSALLLLTISKVNGTSVMVPIGAMGVACACLSMLTLLPALLTIFGRRAFWPFVPHTQEWVAAQQTPTRGLGRRIVEGSRLTALLPAIGACVVVALLLPLVIVNALLRGLTRGAIPSLIVGPLDRAIFKPYELRRVRHEHLADATHGAWKRVGDVVSAHTVRVMLGSVAVLLVMSAGLLFF